MSETSDRPLFEPLHDPDMDEMKKVAADQGKAGDLKAIELSSLFLRQLIPETLPCFYQFFSRTELSRLRQSNRHNEKLVETMAMRNTSRRGVVFG